MSKESLKRKLKIQSENFEKALQIKMRYFDEGDNKYFVLDDSVWDKKRSEGLEKTDLNIQEEERIGEKRICEKRRLSYAPMSYQERLDILQGGTEADIYKKRFED